MTIPIPRFSYISIPNHQYPKILQGKKKFHLWKKKNPFEFKGNLIGFGRTINSHPHKIPSSEHNPNPLTKESLRKHPYSDIGHWEEPKDGMSNDAIEGEQSYLEDNLIFSPSMLRLDDLSNPIFKPILDPDDSSYALSPETHDDPRNPPRHPKHRSHQGHKKDQECRGHHKFFWLLLLDRLNTRNILR
jgi:hypothetical protein